MYRMVLALITTLQRSLIYILHYHYGDTRTRSRAPSAMRRGVGKAGKILPSVSFVRRITAKQVSRDVREPVRPRTATAAFDKNPER